jgi:hypothetical protein
MITANILDPVQTTLDPTVWQSPESPTPKLKPQHRKWITSTVTHVLIEAGYDSPKDWLSLVLTGSLTTYQYSEHSDCDVSLFVNTEVFPEWSRGEMIGVVVDGIDGKHLPGTTHPMQCFVVPGGVTKEMLYVPGIRSGYDIASNKWIVPPEHTRAHDVEHEMNAIYRYALQIADKMQMLLTYDPDNAVAYWHMIHKARQRDMRAGRGDYSVTNIVYKFLDKKGLLPEIAQVSGEYIAKTGMAVTPEWWGQFIKDHPYVYHGTAVHRLPGVIQHGLLPWDHEKNELGMNPVWEPLSPGTIPAARARPGHVYFTIDDPGDSPFGLEGSSGAAVIRVPTHTLNPANINPDEDDMWQQPGNPINRPLESWGDYAERIGWGDNPSDTQGSIIEGDRSLAHRGPIPREHIEVIRHVPAPKPLRMAAANHQEILDANRGQNLEGLPGPVNVPGYGPLQFHSHGDIQRIADDYMRHTGLPYNKPTDYVKVDPERAKRIADEYERMPHAPNDPNVAASYDALKNETLAQYQHAVNNGYRFEFYPEGEDPYPNSPREAVLDLHHNKHMYVYPTETGFGTEGTDQPQDHPMLEHAGISWGGRPATYNDVMRAVHDFYGHAKEGVGFRADGEDNAWRQHASMFSQAAVPAMTTETRGQNSWVNFGPYGEHNQRATDDTIYAQNKAGLLPSWTTQTNLHKQASGDVTTIAYQKTLANGGVTINLAGQEPDQGFAFPYSKETEITVPVQEFSPGMIEAYIEAHRAELQLPDNYLGLWVDGPTVYIDISTVLEDEDEAFNRALAAQQIAMWDLGNNREVPVLRAVQAATAPIQKFDVDPDAIEQARAHLGLEHPVNINLVPQAISQSGEYYSGGYRGMQDGAHRFDLVSWLRPETASKLMWHELTHAAQYERDPNAWQQGMPSYLRQQAQGLEAYKAHPWELEAKQKEQEHPFPLVVTSKKETNDGKLSRQVGQWPLDEEVRQ